jgi:hypothetical protein
LPWRARLRREAILERAAEFDRWYHVSLRPAFPSEYDVGGLVAITFRWQSKPRFVFVTALDPAAALRVGARLGLDEGEALAMIDSHERVHVEIQLAGVSEEAEEHAARHVDAVWLSLRHPRAAHLVEEREINLVTRVGPDFWERLIAPE